MKKHFLFVFIFWIFLSIVGDAIAEVCENNVPTILDSKFLGGFYLDESYKDTYKWDELNIPYTYYTKSGIDVDKMKTKTVVKFVEIWCTIEKEKFKKWGIIKIPKETDYTYLVINRTYMKSYEAALEWAKSDFLRHPLDDCSFSGKAIGDKCWSNKSTMQKTSIILFVKNNAIVKITVSRKKAQVSVDFAEKVASEVARRI